MRRYLAVALFWMFATLPSTAQASEKFWWLFDMTPALGIGLLQGAHSIMLIDRPNTTWGAPLAPQGQWKMIAIAAKPVLTPAVIFGNQSNLIRFQAGMQISQSETDEGSNIELGPSAGLVMGSFGLTMSYYHGVDGLSKGFGLALSYVFKVE